MDTDTAVIGLDFGSLSCRGVLVSPADGRILAEAVRPYEHGVLGCLPDGSPVPEGFVLQDPRDFTAAMAGTVRDLMNAPDARDVLVTALGIDTTASTLIPVRRDLTPLCAEERFSADPRAYAVMWKDHRAVREASMLTEALHRVDLAWLGRLGGSVGAESLIAKAAHICLNAPAVYEAAFAFMELGDWLCSLLADKPIMSLTTLTCKDLYQEGTGYPDTAFFEAIDPQLGNLPRKLMPWGREQAALGHPGEPAGVLCPAMAARLGLPEGVILTFAQMDGYAGLPGAGISEPGELLMTVGTSTGFFLLSGKDRGVHGVCAAVPGSMLPGFTGIAAGQAASGDAFQWYVDHAVPAAYQRAAAEARMDIHSWLCERVRALPDNAPHPIALDWLNGNKSPLNRPDLDAVIMGLTLGTKPEQIYRALMESTAFGARWIVETLAAQEIPVTRILVNGGIALKNPLLMQLYADVLGRPLAVTGCAQTAALGSAMAAAAAAEREGYRRWPEIIRRMAPGTAAEYLPRPEKRALYDGLYRKYRRLAELLKDDAELQGG